MRKKRLFLNTITSVLYMFVTLMCGFILPRYILKGYGSDVNGLVSSINQFLSFISLMDLGVGAVIQSSYYKPLADKDLITISKLYMSSKKFFRNLAYILVAYILLLCIVYPLVVDTKFSHLEVSLLIIILAIGLFAQYFFSAADQLLLSADQKLYIQSGFQTGTVIINTLLCIILIKIGASIHFVKFVSSLVFLARPLFFMWYIRKNYVIDRNIKLEGFRIEQKWNGLAQHIATVIMNNTDIMILSILSQISIVSIYSIYAMVTNGIKQFISALSNGFFSLLGDLYAREERERLDYTFGIFQWSINIVVVFFFTIAALLIVPFVSLYTSGINDVEYHQPLFAYLLIAGQAVFCLRIPFNTMVCSAGHYKQTQMSAVVEAVLNIVISLVLVYRYGLIGVAIGTLIAITYRTISFCIYLHKNILMLEYKIEIKLLLVDLVETLIILCIGRTILRGFPQIDNMVLFALGCICLSISSMCVILVVNYFAYKDYLNMFLKSLSARLMRKRQTIQK